MRIVSHFVKVSADEYNRINDDILRSYNPSGLAFVNTLQDDNNDLDQIRELLEDENIVSASFATHTGDYNPLFVSYTNWPNDGQWVQVKLQKVVYLDKTLDDKTMKYELGWTTDLSLKTGMTIIHKSNTLQGIRDKIRELLQHNTYWKTSIHYSIIEPITINGQKPFAMSALGLKAYPVKTLAKRKLESGKYNYLIIRRVL